MLCFCLSFALSSFLWCSLSLFRSFFCLPWGPQNRITTRETPTNRKRAALKWRRQPQSGDDRPEVVTTGPEVVTTGPEVATTRHRSGDDQAQKWRRPARKWRRPGPEVATNRDFSSLFPDFPALSGDDQFFQGFTGTEAFLGALGFGEASGRLRGGFRKASGRLRLPTRIFRLFHRSATNVKHISMFSRIFLDRSLFRCLRLWGGFGEDLGRLLLYGPAPFGRLGQVTDS